MSSLRTIRRRIRGVGNIRDITKAMQMISASRLKRVETMYGRTRSYTGNLRKLLSRVLSKELIIGLPLYEEREVKKELVILITGERGLCGSFNANLIRKFNEYRERRDGDISVYAIGKAGSRAAKRYGWKLFDKASNLGHKYSKETIEELVQGLLKVYLSGEFDTVNILSMLPETRGTHIPVIEPYLNLRYLFDEKDSGRADLYYIYEPSAGEVLVSLSDSFIRHRLHSVMLRSASAEYAARMIAMKTATDNSDDLIDELTLKRNKLRQSMITREISEIISGANAMN